MPSASEVRSFFDAVAPRYDRDYARPASEIARRLRRALGELDRPRVLDLGIGTGRELPALADLGAVVTGVDVSPRMLDEARRRGRPVELLEADFYAPLPFADSSFDAVIALHGSLAHPPSEAAVEALVPEVARVLRRRGTFYAELPTPAWLASRGVLGDPKSGAAIDAIALEPSRWRELLGRAFDVVDVRAPSGEVCLLARLR